jgi:acyl-CoA synthetase (NDP forming)
MEEPLMSSPLTPVFTPRSIALVGATATPGKVGERIVTNLVDNGFSGAVYPVNPKAEAIRGVICYPDIEAIPGPVDVGYVLVPAAAAVDAVWALGRAGAKAAIVAASGFAETNTDAGRAMQARLAEATAETGIRIVGPNCNGIYNATDGVSIGFNTAHGWKLPAGAMGVVSHSGALFSTLMLRAQTAGAGLSLFVSSGNECDLTMLDHMQHLVEDEPTRCIALIMDSLEDHDRFAHLVDAAWDRGKRVVALKLGTSESGATAAVAHSSRLAGSAQAYAALFEHLGVGQVNTIEELVAAAAIIEHSPLPPRPGIGVVASSGGAGTLVADAADRHRVVLPALSAASRRRVEEIAPGAPVVNPVDLGAAYGKLTLPIALGLICGDEEVDAVLNYYHPMTDDAARLALVQQLAASRDASGKPHLLLAPGGLDEMEARAYRDAGIVVLHETDICLAAIAAASSPRPDRSSSSEEPRPTVRLPAGSGVPDDETSIRIATELGVPMVRTDVVETVDEAVAAADGGWPVVLKGVAEGVAHKSDLGFVVVGLQDEESLRNAAVKLQGLGAKRLLVQPMESGDLEALLGVVTEPGLGRFLVFGLGGVYTEALADAAMVPVDAGRDEIGAALDRTRLGAVLRSARWSDPATRDALVDVLCRVGRAVTHAGPELAALDVNPLVIRGARIVGVDALAVLDR